MASSMDRPMDAAAMALSTGGPTDVPRYVHGSVHGRNMIDHIFMGSPMALSTGPWYRSWCTSWSTIIDHGVSHGCPWSTTGLVMVGHARPRASPSSTTDSTMAVPITCPSMSGTRRLGVYEELSVARVYCRYLASERYVLAGKMFGIALPVVINVVATCRDQFRAVPNDKTN